MTTFYPHYYQSHHHYPQHPHIYTTLNTHKAPHPRHYQGHHHHQHLHFHPPPHASNHDDGVRVTSLTGVLHAPASSPLAHPPAHLQPPTCNRPHALAAHTHTHLHVQSATVPPIFPNSMCSHDNLPAYLLYPTPHLTTTARPHNKHTLTR
ncbi:hypothetical protein Pmani_019464 [Petrolisthes manimaculis]|uniref:Uncharacterized protein n=1 Tax=Petrolisthes manimaculis TaxID=1843537 RepID=A0AAE1PHL8_9EUCA|nr:hypothetical protein Pmani_019464 [Petrolisthes manimaculis]